MSDPAALLDLDPGAWPATAPAPQVLAELAAGLAADEPPAPSVAAPDAVPALVALLPAALDRHRRLDVPADVTRDTLADVGRKLRAYGATTDVGWLLGLLRADVLALGRLQFQRLAGAAGRAVHVPEQGPLDPVRVDTALRRAATELGPGPVTCTSWLLDPALPDGLPADSNIVRFAARFAVLPGEEAAGGEGGPTAGDHAVARFVFRQPLDRVLDPSAVLPTTRLEHLVAAHLRAGRHWTEPCGVLRQHPPDGPARCDRHVDG
ncbi:acyltransferase domain-containing protein [uncultured Modestobacter sp.]|uniref:acyltransferase domain-containing protein n=1 Tax=uncultured Modestobacter sp. TaxID=380048 RepID=UPI00260F6437|nr:acyltransferase domain-containing protein [uncultured Modestobacter sp.]